MNNTISECIPQLLQIVNRLRSAYPAKRFTLDGRLVGDIGEVIAESVYDIKLHESQQKHHDAVTPDGRQVQIKATMQKNLTFPCDHIPDYYLGIKILPDGSFEEIFNGPGSIAYQAVENRKVTKTNLHIVAINKLRGLNKEVEPVQRITRRK